MSGRQGGYPPEWDLPELIRRFIADSGWRGRNSGGPFEASPPSAPGDWSHGEGWATGSAEPWAERHGAPHSGPPGPPEPGPYAFAGPPWAWGPGAWWGPGPGHRRGRRARGDVRAAVLTLLGEEPMHGYQIIQEIERRTGGAWKASPGSVYPTLQQLEDEGLVRAEDRAGRRVFRLTDDGRRETAERAGEFAGLWDRVGGGDDRLGDLVAGVASAFVRVMHSGSGAQIDRARTVLVRTRADLQRILDGDQDDGTDSGRGGERQ